MNLARHRFFSVMTIVFAVVVSVMACGVSFAQPVDSDKDVYQMDWGVMPPGNMWLGGKWSPREMPQTELTPAQRAQIEAQHTAAMYRKAAYYSWIIVFIACVASYMLKAREGIGIAIMAAGFSFASSYMAQSVHYALRIGACLGVVVFVGICFVLREKGFSFSTIVSIVKKRTTSNDHIEKTR